MIVIPIWRGLLQHSIEGYVKMEGRIEVTQENKQRNKPRSAGN